ncbi:MAG: YceI family protein, partial [Burkholderiales bacterium]|nr:YceI family protein [Burkholderiales bacterium]
MPTSPGRRPATHGLALAALLLAGAARPAAAAPAVYDLIPEQTFVQFSLLHFDTSTLRGRIGPVAGTVTLDPEAGTGYVGLTIPTGTVDAGLPVFTARIRRADLLATQAWPQAYFVASHIRFDHGQPAALRGEFTLRGVSQPLTLRAEHFACRTERSGAAPVQVCGGDFEAAFDRSDFGITFGLPFVGNRVRLQ